MINKLKKYSISGLFILIGLTLGLTIMYVNDARLETKASHYAKFVLPTLLTDPSVHKLGTLNKLDITKSDAEYRYSFAKGLTQEALVTAKAEFTNGSAVATLVLERAHNQWRIKDATLRSPQLK